HRHSFRPGLGPHLTFGRRGRKLGQRIRAGVYLVLPRYSLLNSQDSFADLATAIFHDRRLPISVRPAQLRDQASSKSIFGQGSLEPVFMLQLLPLLCGEIRFKKNFARIILLSHKNARSPDEKNESEQSRGGAPHAMSRRKDKPATGRFSFHRQRELVERLGKVESFCLQKKIQILKSCFCGNNGGRSSMVEPQ